MKTTIRSLLISTIVLLLPALAGGESRDYTYQTTAGTITITGYRGPGGPAVIPDTIDGLPVTRIADSAFSSQMTLTGVTIPDSVIDLGGGAFFHCTNLAVVNLGKGITSRSTQVRITSQPV